MLRAIRNPSKGESAHRLSGCSRFRLNQRRRSRCDSRSGNRAASEILVGAHRTLDCGYARIRPDRLRHKRQGTLAWVLSVGRRYREVRSSARPLVRHRRSRERAALRRRPLVSRPAPECVPLVYRAHACRPHPGCGRDGVPTTAIALAHVRAAAAHRGERRPVLHVFQPGRRCGNHRGARGRAHPDRRRRGLASYRYDR